MSDKIPTSILFEQEVDGIKRKLSAVAAYDFPPPNRACHGLELWFEISRGDVCIQFVVHTGMHLERVRRRWTGEPSFYANVFTHSPVPFRKDQELDSENCGHTHGRCYCVAEYIEGSILGEKFLENPNILWVELTERLLAVEVMVNEEKSLARNFS